MTEAPDDGETYLFAYYASNEAENYRSIYTYTRLNMTSASQEANLDFGTSKNNLTVTAKLPAGYQYPVLSVNVFNGFRALKNIYSRTQTQESTFAVSTLPVLLTGDAYGLSITAVNSVTTEVALKAISKYGIAEGAAVDLDLSAVPDLRLSGPADGASLNSIPAFSWEAISGDRIIYMASVVSEDSWRTIWMGYTRGNSIALPDAVSLANGTYRWQIAAAYFSNLDLADLGPTLAQSYLNWRVVSAVRRFTYVK